MRTVVWVLGALALVACNRPGPSTDSKSNWLQECATQRDCGAGLSCICGVCTTACTGATACDRGAADVQCTDPVQAGLPAACAEALEGDGSRVCLASCSASAQCGSAQTCVKGSCIATAAASVQQPDLGGGGAAGTGGRQAVAGSAASSTESGADGSVIPFDGGLWPPIPDGSVDAADGGGSSDAACTNCCGPRQTCADGLVCHVDDTCVVPGVVDGDGTATLDGPFRAAAALYAANDDYVFGTDNTLVQGLLLRWSASGGAGERVAQEPFFFSPYTRVLIAGEFVYFTAALDPIADNRATLFRVPIEGRNVPADAFGNVGFYLVHDEQFLFFTDPGNTSVIRAPKAMPTEREVVYTVPSGAVHEIVGLALNSDTLFVLDVLAEQRTNFIVRAVDKATLAPNGVQRDPGEPLTPKYLFATDDYVIVAGDAAVERIDLATGAVARRSIAIEAMAQVGGSLYLTNTLSTEPRAMGVHRLEIATGMPPRPLLTADYLQSVVPTATAIFTLVRAEGADWSLVRIDEL